jgi:hypothetical protein
LTSNTWIEANLCVMQITKQSYSILHFLNNYWTIWSCMQQEKNVDSQERKEKITKVRPNPWLFLLLSLFMISTPQIKSNYYIFFMISSIILSINHRNYLTWQEEIFSASSPQAPLPSEGSGGQINWTNFGPIVEFSLCNLILFPSGDQCAWCIK